MYSVSASDISRNTFLFDLLVSSIHTAFPRLDTLHVLDASAHFDAGWRGRNTFWTPAEFNVQIDASAPFDSGHTTHNLLIDAQASN